MSRYVEFATASDGLMLVEVDAADLATAAGVEKAGLRDRRATGDVARAASTFEDAVGSALRRSASVLADAIDSLPRRPSEVELTFGLKATGEVGNIAVAKAGGEANFTVRLAWRAEME